MGRGNPTAANILHFFAERDQPQNSGQWTTAKIAASLHVDTKYSIVYAALKRLEKSGDVMRCQTKPGVAVKWYRTPVALRMQAFLGAHIVPIEDLDGKFTRREIESLVGRGLRISREGLYTWSMKDYRRILLRAKHSRNGNLNVT